MVKPKYLSLKLLVIAAVAGVFVFAVFADQVLVTKLPGDLNKPASQLTGDLKKMEDPRVLITKGERKLEVFDGEKLVATFKIALGSNPVGDKEVEGDGKTPEGDFYIFTKNPKSSFYLSLGISYPNSEDAERGLENGLISQEEHDQIVSAINEKRTPLQNTRLGGEIYIHGNGNLTDWTLGCIALKNKDIKILFDSLPVKTPVSIIP